MYTKDMIRFKHELVGAGVKYPPHKHVIKKYAQKEIIAKFERLLVSYAKFHGWSRTCIGMSYVEASLLILAGKGVNQTHPDHLLVALAGVIGKLAYSEYEVFVSQVPMHTLFTCDGCEWYMKRMEVEAISKSATWLFSKWKHQPLFFWRRRENSFMFLSEAMEILSRLLKDYFLSKLPAANVPA